MKAYSVTQINKYIKAVFDEDLVLRGVKIEGEISNFKINYAGHAYFTLKDAESAMSCVMFAGETENLAFMPEDGMKVSVTGNISVYVKSGQYQLYARKIEREGAGDLFLKFEELKRRLAAEGLFAPERKKPVPAHPKRLAVITSATGAAVRDIISVARRRNKTVDIVVFPVAVQGVRAAEEIAVALRECNRQKAADTVIIGRGGGSIEDLWAFNEELVARAVYESEIPVISAVGHETDFTIADFAADFRAATPSVSAEIAVPPLVDRRALVKSVVQLLGMSMNRIINDKARELAAVTSVVEAYSPLAVLARGYSLTYDEGGALIKSVGGVKTGDTVTTALPDGEIISRITDIRTHKNV